MIPIVSIVAKSGAGKTTLIEKMIPELNRRGYRVATIKHAVHGFDIDHEGKDSRRHRKAGAHATIISSPCKVALIEDVEKDHKIAELRDRYIRDVDIILSEGYKGSPHPKIEVSRSETKQGLLCTKEDDLVAIVSDNPLNIGVPWLDINDVARLVDIIEERFLRS